MYNRIEYLRKDVQKLLDYGYNDDYIRTAILEGQFLTPYTIEEINTAIDDIKSILACNN
jgi:hypothetical protein